VTNVVPSDAPAVPTTLVVGPPRSGKSSLVNGLLGSPALAAVDVPDSGVRPVGSAFLTFRHGEDPAATAYLPGNRGARPLSLDELRAGDLAGLVRGAQGRPPRRIEVTHPSDLLRRVTLVDTPGAGGFDQAYVDVVLDVLDSGAALLFVTEASAALAEEHLEFLAEVDKRGTPVTFVLTKIDAYPEWPAVLAADQNLVRTHVPGLADRPWYAVSARTGAGSGSVTIEEAALGVAGVGLEALRRALAEPVPVEGPAEPRPAAVARVVAGATDVRWMEELDREIRLRSVAAGQRLAIDLASIHVRCVQQIGSGAGCPRLAYVFDRELHGLSVRTTRAVDAAATAIMRGVFGEILEEPPDDAALARIRRATRRALESPDIRPAWDRILLVTVTSAIAVTSGHGTVASLAPVRPRPLSELLLPPIAIGLSAGCYLMWQQKAPDRKECQGWLQQAVRALETHLQREVVQRFDQLREALVTVAGDTVDHGVLLA